MLCTNGPEVSAITDSQDSNENPRTLRSRRHTLEVLGHFSDYYRPPLRGIPALPRLTPLTVAALAAGAFGGKEQFAASLKDYTRVLSPVGGVWRIPVPPATSPKRAVREYQENEFKGIRSVEVRGSNGDRPGAEYNIVLDADRVPRRSFLLYAAVLRRCLSLMTALGVEATVRVKCGEKKIKWPAERPGFCMEPSSEGQADHV